MDTNKRELLGRYQIVSELGSGGMGTVYLTRNTTLQRDGAIKVLNDATVVDAVSVERFKREVKAIASLSHPNVIGLYDFTDEDGTYFAVMEYAQGTTLDERMTAQPLARDEAMQISVCSAISSTVR
jgi:serine/threonine-protein kinase